MFQRAMHSPKAGISHVILTGNISYATIVEFCREFFHLDQESVVVILHATPPSTETRRLLNLPSFRSRLLYLQGDVMNRLDLERARAECATAIFILTKDTAGRNQLVEIPGESPSDVLVNEHDTQSLQVAMNCKTTYPGLPIFAQVNEQRCRDLAADCGIDRTVCINEIKTSLVARNCINPGLQTMVMNLVCNFDPSEFLSAAELWIKEYQCGLANEVQTLRVPTGLIGILFRDLVQEVFSSFNVIVFALKTENLGYYHAPIRFSIPPHYRLASDDVLYCLGDG
ncbi:hypothetical protein HDU91_004533, partial [Kappamyces sp. JEL0680]